ncbi:hypothetical protein J4221_06430 [Candidatus Pacearchaeota archaeon]|nr:hypothetical protein [Candidatus Pacearchaeota archaeon]
MKVHLTDNERKLYYKEKNKFLTQSFHNLNPKPDELFSKESLFYIDHIIEISNRYLTYSMCNLFNIVFLNHIGIKTPSLQELTSISDNDIDIHYNIDIPAVLIGGLERYYPNRHIAKELAHSLDIKEFDYPIIVEGLELIVGGKFSNFGYYGGLSFRKNENSKIFRAPDFNTNNYLRKFSKINPDYSIEWDEEGDKTFSMIGNRDLSGIEVNLRDGIIYADKVSLHCPIPPYHSYVPFHQTI